MDIERPKLTINGIDHSTIVIWALLVLGVVLFLYPKAAWWWEEGWRFRDRVEPSGLWLLLTRIGGLIAALIMAWMLTHDGKFTITPSH